MEQESELIADNPYYAEATSGPAEIYEPVQTLYFFGSNEAWWVDTGKDLYEVKEIYCNVPSAAEIIKVDAPPDMYRMVAVGRLTISSGVAYVDVG